MGLGMPRVERYSKPGGRPVVEPATIHDDLLRRDFRLNVIRAELNRVPRLLFDLNDGLADLRRRELRAVSNYSCMTIAV